MILKNYTDGMEIISPDLRDSLLNRLHTLIKDTERVFLTVGEDLPSLLKEMTRGINEARAAIENFREEGCLEDETDCRNVHAIISETQELINVSSQSFQQMHEQDAELFEELNTGIENLSSLERIIGNIKEDSIEMELISLNAMTAALKSGSAGKAFSYITEELKRLSENTISFTDELTQRGDRTLELFHRFRDQVASISDFQNKLFKNFRTKLDDSFSQYNMGLNQIMEALENIIDTAETIKKPLTTIMEEIQLQDIIKQSVDHVIIAVKEINTELSKDRSEALLDELSYLGNLADLSQSMLNDIADKVQSSLDIFNEQTREARGIIEGVDEKKTSFMQNFMEEEGEIALRRIFSDAAEALRKTLEDLDSSMSKKQSLYQTSSELTSEV
ncbi:MAG: methyl-accepting chemotaxis protein, partial [Spirochaetales bacterium]|nr:methyl-accepting chemotaxis protein [Spirochaetales bacterium]MCF7938454.1 methyl-accepting chemotaxis protein [Spirochaetales bacterium]